MQHNGTGNRIEGRGKVSRVSEYGFKIDGRDGWYSFPRSEEREGTFEIPVVGDFVEYRYMKDEGGTWVHAINVLNRYEPPEGGLPLDHGRRRNEASWSMDREERLIRLLKVVAENYSGRAMGPEDLMRDAMLLEREFIRALKGWGG